MSYRAFVGTRRLSFIGVINRLYTATSFWKNCLCREVLFGLVCKGEIKKKKTIANPVNGIMLSPKDVSYHTSIQIFQTFYLCELLHHDDGAFNGLLLRQLDLQGILLRKGLATSAEMVGLQSQDTPKEKWKPRGTGTAGQLNSRRYLPQGGTVKDTVCTWLMAALNTFTLE